MPSESNIDTNAAFRESCLFSQWLLKSLTITAISTEATRIEKGLQVPVEILNRVSAA